MQWFEGRSSRAGATTRPCFAALYPGVAVLALAHVTNTAAEDHSHEENLRRADARSGVLSAVLSTAAGVFFES